MCLARIRRKSCENVVKARYFDTVLHQTNEEFPKFGFLNDFVIDLAGGKLSGIGDADGRFIALWVVGNPGLESHA